MVETHCFSFLDDIAMKKKSSKEVPSQTSGSFGEFFGNVYRVRTEDRQPDHFSILVHAINNKGLDSMKQLHTLEILRAFFGTA